MRVSAGPRTVRARGQAASFFFGFIAWPASGLWVIVVAIMMAVRNPSPEGI